MDRKPEERFILRIIKNQVSFNIISLIQTKTTFETVSNFSSSQLPI